MKKHNKTILMITSSFPRYEGDYFGPWILDYCRELVNQGAKVIVLAPAVADGDLTVLSSDKLIIKRFNYWWPRSRQRLVHPPGMIPQMTANPLRIPQLPFLLYSYYKAAKSILLSTKVDIIHCQWIIPSGFIGALLKRRFKRPLVITSQGAELYLSKRHPFSYVTRWTITKTDKLLPVSQQMAVRAKDFGASDDQVSVVPNAVNTDVFSPRADNSFRKEHNIPLGATIILTVRRLVKEKRVEDVITAYKGLKEKDNVYLVIAGDGPEKSGLQSLAKTDRSAKKIIFLGFVDNIDLPAIYASSDIYVLSSQQEGLSLSMLEAMASGCIVISTRGTGGGEVIKDGVNGYLYEVGQVDELNQAITSILTLDEDDRDNVKKLACQGVEAQYSTEKMVRRWDGHYQDLLS